MSYSENMKNLLRACVSFIFLPAFCIAGPVKLTTLTSFVDEFSFHDNHRRRNREEVYFASKFYPSLDGVVEITAYPKTGKAEFEQITLSCDQCRTELISLKLNQICRDHFKNLYKKLTSGLSSAHLESFVGTKHKRNQDPSSSFDIRFLTGFLKCDTKGGRRIRVDFFSPHD